MQYWENPSPNDAHAFGMDGQPNEPKGSSYRKNALVIPKDAMRNIPEYADTDCKIDILRWIRKIEETVETFGLPKEECIRIAEMKSSGQLTRVMQNSQDELAGKKDTWEDLRRALINRFTMANAPEELLQKWSTNKCTH